MGNNRWQNYGLWASILAFIPLVLSSFGIELIGDYQEIVNAFLGILVMAGIISNPTTKGKGFKDDTDETPSETDPNKPN